MIRDIYEDTDRELALKLRELERDQEDEDSLFPKSFMQEFTDFKTWDEFKVRLAATPRPERRSFVMSTTRSESFEEMERTALERLGAARSGEVQRAADGVGGDGPPDAAARPNAPHAAAWRARRAPSRPTSQASSP